ncbi:MAG: hypothetical protein QOJ45_1803 [Verrucomicrobiota bacterium]|jgi:hypothetical protein
MRKVDFILLVIKPILTGSCKTLSEMAAGHFIFASVIFPLSHDDPNNSRKNCDHAAA